MNNSKGIRPCQWDYSQHHTGFYQ